MWLGVSSVTEHIHPCSFGIRLLELSLSLLFPFLSLPSSHLSESCLGHVAWCKHDTFVMLYKKVLFIYYNSSITIQSSVTHYQMSVPLSLPLNTIRLYHEFIHHSVIHTNPVGLLSLSFVNQSVFVKLLFLPVKRISQSFCNRQASPWHFLACFALGRADQGKTSDIMLSFEYSMYSYVIECMLLTSDSSGTLWIHPG